MKLIAKNAFLLACGLLACALPSRAGQIPYGNIGQVNTTTYTYTAAATGDVIGYFMGSGASWSEDVGMLINGTLSTNGFGLNDHTTSVGGSFNFGAVTAGDTLTFVLRVINSGGTLPANQLWYTDPLLNGGAGNHVYSTSAVINQVYGGSPAGTYVAFEDAPLTASDLNYFDDTFIFTNVASHSAGVPDGGTTAVLLGMAFTGLAVLRRRIVRA